MEIIPVPCLSDNYAYLVVCPQSGATAIVDPSEAAPLTAQLKQHGLEPVAIFNTHHHWDHTGGNADLLKAFPELEVYGHASDAGRIEGLNRPVEDGSTFTLGTLPVRVLFNPGHTSGAISYVVGDAVFTGDTLFASGCGRLFEGSPAMMHHSLNTVLGALPKTTRVFFGHEYTAANLRFAAFMEPNNAAIQAKATKVEADRKAHKPTTPSTLADEWATNPFMRSDSPELQAKVKETEPDHSLKPADILRVVRQLKDRF